VTDCDGPEGVDSISAIFRSATRRSRSAGWAAREAT